MIYDFVVVKPVFFVGKQLLKLQQMYFMHREKSLQKKLTKLCENNTVSIYVYYEYRGQNNNNNNSQEALQMDSENEL